MPAAAEHSRLFYLKYLRLGDLWSEIKQAVLMGAVGSVLFDGMYLAYKTGSAMMGSSSILPDFWVWTNVIPKEAWFLLWIGLFTWIFRGQSIDLPKVTFLEWSLGMLLLSGMLAAALTLPVWAFLPVYMFSYTFAEAFQKLVKFGREKCKEEVEVLV